MVNLFITTLKTRTTSFLILQPNLKLFHLSTCHEVFIMNTNISHKQLLYNAGDVIIATLKLTAPRSALNIAFEAANAYRRAIRTIQR